MASGLGYVPARWVVTEERLFVADRVAGAIVAFPLDTCGDPQKVSDFAYPVDALIENENDLYAATGGNSGHRGLFRISTSTGTASELYSGAAARPFADATHIYFWQPGRVMRVPKIGGGASVVFDVTAHEPTGYSLDSGGVVGEYAYFSVSEEWRGKTSVWRVALSSGQAEIVHQSAAFLWIYVGRDAAYFWDPVTPSATEGTVYRIDAAANQTILPEGAVFPTLEGVDESYLYFYRSDPYSVYVRPIAGGALTPYPFPEGSGGPPWDAPKTSTHAYWSEGTYDRQTQTIVRAPRPLN